MISTLLFNCYYYFYQFYFAPGLGYNDECLFCITYFLKIDARCLLGEFLMMIYTYAYLFYISSSVFYMMSEKMNE